MSCSVLLLRVLNGLIAASLELIGSLCLLEFEFPEVEIIGQSFSWMSLSGSKHSVVFGLAKFTYVSSSTLSASLSKGS